MLIFENFAWRKAPKAFRTLVELRGRVPPVGRASRNGAQASFLSHIALGTPDLRLQQGIRAEGISKA